jgi:hypothetical protein
MNKIALFLMGCVMAGSAYANPISQSTPNGAAYAGVCAGSQYFGGVANPGTSVVAGVGPSESAFVTCSQDPGTVGGTASASMPGSGVSIAAPNVPFSNFIEMAAQAGSISGFADNMGAPLDGFAGVSGSAGFNDSVPFSGPTGILLMPIDVDAILTASGTGESVLEVSAVENGNLLSGSDLMTAFQAANAETSFGDTIAGFGYEVAVWTANSPDFNVVANNQVINFAIPVTNGEPLNFGIFVSFLLNSGDSDDTTISTESLDPPSAYYAGPGTILLPDGSEVPALPSDFGQSASGFDYSQTYSYATPEPGTITLLLTGLGSLAMSRRLRGKTK